MATRKEAEALRKLVLADQTLHEDEVKLRRCGGHWAVQVKLQDAATLEVFCAIFLYGRQQYEYMHQIFPILVRAASW
jgi:hypothetical protein